MARCRNCGLQLGLEHTEARYEAFLFLEWVSLIAHPPTPCRIGKRPPAPENRPAIEELRGGGGGHGRSYSLFEKPPLALRVSVVMVLLARPKKRSVARPGG